MFDASLTVGGGVLFAARLEHTTRPGLAGHLTLAYGLMKLLIPPTLRVCCVNRRKKLMCVACSVTPLACH